MINIKIFGALSLLVIGAGYGLTHQQTHPKGNTMAFLPDAGERSKRGRALLEEADKLWAGGRDFAGAAELYRKAYDEVPIPFIQIRLAQALAKSGRTREARIEFEKMSQKMAAGQMSVVSNDPSFALEVAETAQNLGLPSHAQEIVGGLATAPLQVLDQRLPPPKVDRLPQHALANGYFAAGLSKEHLHEHAAAIELFRKAVQLRPDWGLAHSYLGYALHVSGKEIEARKSFQNAQRHGISIGKLD